MPKVNRPWKAERQKKRREEAEARNAVSEEASAEAEASLALRAAKLALALKRTLEVLKTCDRLLTDGWSVKARDLIRDTLAEGK